MGYFPLPELKGKPNRIFVDGKTLNQIAKESGIRLDTVQHRYSRGIRGKPKRMDAGVHSVIMSHIEEHSKKPAETRDRIVKLMAGGGLPKIELFARQSIDGWDCWGNEV